MQEFIIECGEKPIKPDACSGKAYSSQKLGDLGEQYVKCLFKEMSIVKRKETTESSPDFEITINRKNFLLEAKVVSNLYKNPLRLLNEIANDKSTKKKIFGKIKKIFENYDFTVDPIDIHREDEKIFKEEFKKYAIDVKLPIEKASFIIECKIRKYWISMEAKSIKIKGISSVFSGFQTNETKSLSNIFYKKVRQIANSDILVVILLNRSIESGDLLDFFYSPINMCLESTYDIKQNSQPLMITQYNYKNTIWQCKYKDEQGHPHIIGDKLKCIFVIYPYFRNVIIFPSYKYFVNFTSVEYLIIKEILKAKEFSCSFASHEVRIVN